MSNKRRYDFTLKPDQLTGVPGELADALNDRMKRISEALESASGLRGPVRVAKQKKKENNPGREHVDVAGLNLEENRGANCADPIDDLDIVNLRTLKRFLECKNLIKILDKCQDTEDLIEGLDDDQDTGNCQTFRLQQRIGFDMNVANAYGVKVLGRYAFVAVQE